jgi:hypothetical protein
MAIDTPSLARISHQLRVSETGERFCVTLHDLDVCTTFKKRDRRFALIPFLSVNSHFSNKP